MIGLGWTSLPKQSQGRSAAEISVRSAATPRSLLRRRLLKRKLLRQCQEKPERRRRSGKKFSRFVVQARGPRAPLLNSRKEKRSRKRLHQFLRLHPFLRLHLFLRHLQVPRLHRLPCQEVLAFRPKGLELPPDRCRLPVSVSTTCVSPSRVTPQGKAWKKFPILIASCRRYLEGPAGARRRRVLRS